MIFSKGAESTLPLFVGGDEMAITIIPMAERHVVAIAALEAQCFSDPWSEASLAEELDNSHAVFYVATDGERVLGYAGMHHIGDEGYIDNVAVSPDARRRGIARQLMSTLERYGRDNGLYRLTLEVRASNVAALALYEGAGYVCDGVRPSFYRKPTEDAVICSLYL